MPKLITPDLVAPALVKPELVVPFPAYYGSLSSYAAGGSGGGGLDPALVEFLLDAENGTNGNQDATDISGNSRTIEWGGAGKVTTAKFYQGSKGLDFWLGGGDMMRIANISFEEENFTVEWFQRASGYSPYTRPSVNTYNGSAGSWGFLTTNNPDNFARFLLRNAAGDGDLLITGSTAMSTGSSGNNVGGWNHIAICRVGNTITLYLNGVSQGTLDCTGISVGGTNPYLYVGGGYFSPNTFNRYDAWYDMIRIVKGQSVYSGDFTPPLEYS